MKFDREVLIAIIICAVILFGWDPLARKMGWAPAKKAQTEKVEEPAETPSEKSGNATEAKAPETGKPEKSAPAAAPAGTQTIADVPKKNSPPEPPKLADIRLENHDVVVTVDPNRGAVTAILLKKYKATIPLKKESGFFRLAKHPDHKAAEPLSLATADALDLAIDDKRWRVVSANTTATDDSRSLTLVRRMVNDDANEEFTVTQEWRIGKDGYKIEYEATITNSGGKALVLPKMQVGGGALGSSRQVSGDTVRGDSHYLDYMTPSGDHNDLAVGAGSGGGCSCSAGNGEAKFRAVNNQPVRWAALSNKYFCMILAGRNTPRDMVVGRTGDGKAEKSFVISDGMIVSDGSRELKPGATVNYAFDYYCGPKILHNLESFDPSTSKVMHLSWGPLNYLARFMLWILLKLHVVFRNYGVCIIILTLLVRLLFYPITARGNASMKKMQAVQPKLKELREKYKDNPQLMNTKMMELYREEGINPFGGCLPILLQIPVFFALYSTFNGAVELRQSSFLWCHNLAAADTVAYILSIPINPLVLIMTALMVLQQHLTPMSMDPMQKKMMMVMPVVMLFLFYDLPSGLTLYWTVSNIFSIIQLRLQQRGSKTTEAATAAKN